MKSGAVLNPTRWYSGYPGYDVDTTVLFGARNPSKTYADTVLTRSKAVSQFRSWLADRMPGAYRAVMQQAPHLLAAERAGVAGVSGLNPLGPAFGMGQSDDTITAGAAATDFTPFFPGQSTPSGGTAPSTGGGPGDWASSLFNLAAKAVPIVGQVQLLQTNIARAKAGLPPIDPATIAPQFHVGLTRSTLMGGGAGLLIIGGVVLAAIALAKRR
jgi:hypothetical protein